MNPATKRIVIATDVRFWQRSTGAQQRIYSMVEYLQGLGHQVTTLFCGTLAEPNGESSLEYQRQQIQANKLTVLSVLDDWKPTGLVQKAIWQFQCIANWLLKGSVSNGQANHLQSKPATTEGAAAIQPKRLKDYSSPLIKQRFHQMLTRIDADIVLAQYVIMSWLVPDQKPPSPKWWVDSHDHLSERARQFKQFGHPHWLEISAEEETEAMAKFDLVIAIQSDEAKTFEESLAKLSTNTQTKVIVAGHPRNISTPKTNVADTDGKVFSVGYFGSDNPSNVDAVQWFLEDIWPGVLAEQPKATLLLAGTICNSFPSASEQPGVVTRPKIDSVGDLYRSFQVAINPVRFGTGLKIKNQEALAFAKPLVVTAQGATGMVLPDQSEGCDNTSNPILIAEDAGSFAKHVVGLLSDPARIANTKQAATQYAKRYLSAEFVYQELTEAVNSVR